VGKNTKKGGEKEKLKEKDKDELLK